MSLARVLYTRISHLGPAGSIDKQRIRRRYGQVSGASIMSAQVEPRWRSGFYGQMRGISLRPWRRYTLKSLSSVSNSQGSISSLSLINDASARDAGTLL